MKPYTQKKAIFRCPRKKHQSTTRDDAEKGVKFLAFFALLRKAEEEMKGTLAKLKILVIVVQTIWNGGWYISSFSSDISYTNLYFLYSKLAKLYVIAF